MQKQEGKLGTISRNVHGEVCAFCGRYRYHLVLRSMQEPQVGKLLARCTHCHRLREIDEKLERILWM